MNDYMVNMWIDAIQNAKASFVNTWVKTEEINKPINEFIKLQTEFTKIAFEATDKFANVAGEAIAKAVK
jgi:hypothetical protein